MSKQIRNYIRGFRKRANLTQGELAYLLGCQYGAKISRYERRVQEPNLYSAFSCQAVFRVPVHQLLPDVYARVESSVIERAHQLYREIENSEEAPRLIQHKQSFLRDVISQEPMQQRSELWENRKNMRFYLP